MKYVREKNNNNDVNNVHADQNQQRVGMVCEHVPVIGWLQ